MLPSQKELKELLDYNPLTGILKWKNRPRTMFLSDRACSTWNSRYAGKQAFTSTDRKGYHVGAIHNVNYRASRVIFKWMTDIDADIVDHENGNNQDNTWNNLRNVSGSQNQQNMKRAKNNTSGITGVSWNSQKNKWDAVIRYKGKHINLGRFLEIQDAIDARKAAEKTYGYHPNHGRH